MGAVDAGSSIDLSSPPCAAAGRASASGVLGITPPSSPAREASRASKAVEARTPEALGGGNSLQAWLGTASPARYSGACATPGARTSPPDWDEWDGIVSPIRPCSPAPGTGDASFELASPALLESPFLPSPTSPSGLAKVRPERSPSTPFFRGLERAPSMPSLGGPVRSRGQIGDVTLRAFSGCSAMRRVTDGAASATPGNLLHWRKSLQMARRQSDSQRGDRTAALARLRGPGTALPWR